MTRNRTVVLVGCVSLLVGGLAGAFAQDSGAQARLERKSRKLLETSGWATATRAQIEAEFEASERSGALPPKFLERFRKEADDAALLDALAPVYARNMEEATFDAAIGFYATPQGAKVAEAYRRAASATAVAARRWAADGADRTKAAIRLGVIEEAGADLASLQAKTILLNERNAVSLLQALHAAQVEVLDLASIDLDRDGEGEYGTLAELTGSVGRRRGLLPPRSNAELDGADFSKIHTPISPPALKQFIGAIGKNGVAEKAGYAFILYLPDSGSPSGWVHEVGSSESPSLDGGTGRIGIAAAEKAWRAYAWPLEVGKTGSACFFMDQTGKVLRSENQTAKWSGSTKLPPPESAFPKVGGGQESSPKGAGADGDAWIEMK